MPERTGYQAARPGKRSAACAAAWTARQRKKQPLDRVSLLVKPHHRFPVLRPQRLPSPPPRDVANPS